MADLSVNVLQGYYRLPVGLRLAQGQISFTASPDHVRVTNYEARVWTSPKGGSPLATVNLGTPTVIAGTATIVIDISATLDAVYASNGAGNYLVTVTTYVGADSAESGDSNEFALPLT